MFFSGAQVSMWSVLKIKYGYPSFKIPKKHGSIFECADEKIQFWNVQEETSQNTESYYKPKDMPLGVSRSVPRIIF